MHYKFIRKDAKELTVAVLRSHSQITIPAPIVSSLGLKEGDQLEIFADNGKISMIPVVIYPDDYVEQLRKEIAELGDNIKSGKQRVFDSVDALIDALEKQ